MEVNLFRVCKTRTLIVSGSLFLLFMVYYVSVFVSKRPGLVTVVHNNATNGIPFSTTTTIDQLQRLDFNPHGQESLVFIHIQKTGGSTFLQHLVTVKKNHSSLCVLDPKNASRKKERYMCPGRPEVLGDQWLISEKTVGWMCGLHAFFTEFLYCLQNNKSNRVSSTKKLHFMTMLRHPVLRYLSEYLHIQRGATWSTRHKCNGVEVTDEQMPPCYPGFYKGQPWTNVSFGEFSSCPNNWANNRQTMMLASLSSVGCFDKGTLPPGERDKQLLESAKQNLLDFAFFGITEYLNESCLLFEHMIGLEFGEVPEQRAASDLHSAPILQALWNSKDVYQKIAHVNSLDIELYEFAIDIFSKRLQTIDVTLDEQRLAKEIAEITLNDVSRKKFAKLKYEHIT